jgi:TolA-binding protein
MDRLPGYFCLLVIGSIWGCSGLTSVDSLLSSPLFTPTPEDTARLTSLTHELDNRALHCLDTATCAEVHFARALVSLFENQEAARASFRRVIDDYPSSAVAASSMLWLQLIGEEGTLATSFTDLHKTLLHLMAQSLRDWMARELTQQQKTQPAEVIATDKAKGESAAVVLVLQKQVRERDRRIAILESKLDALKAIDQEDQEQRKRVIKVPSTLP